LIEQGPSSNKYQKPAIPKDLFKPYSFQLPLRKKSADEFWYPTLSRPPPDNCCPGMPVGILIDCVPWVWIH
jgi:hypothetical protein